jgi:multimeric flavodoxin WrbA
LHERRTLDRVECVPTLLIVHHTPSPFMQAMLESVVAGANHEDIEGVHVVVRPALSATAVDVLEADGYVLGTPANLGYMSGALKHFFDTVYYPVLEATQKRPYAVYVHGNEGVEGALRAIDGVATGLKWQRVAEPLIVLGQPEKSDLEACWELGATAAAGLM